jgi:hypothetical protein
LVAGELGEGQDRVAVATASPAAELTLLQVVYSVNEHFIGLHTDIYRRILGLWRVDRTIEEKCARNM